jgi:hypothetical protein
MKKDLVLIRLRLLCQLKRINKSIAIACQAIILLITLSCNIISLKRKSAPDSKKIEVYLNDSVGIISFNKPSRYDTAFSWVHYSDCNTCHEQKYRFQSKGNPILKESRFFWTEPKDSVDRFTISYMKDFPFHGIDTAKDLGSFYHFRVSFLTQQRKRWK